ncbi:hypothetical protein ACFE04_024120 [Oxalis oulophora]
MESNTKAATASASSVRWKILRQALLRNHNLKVESQIEIDQVSRKTKNGFNLIPNYQQISTTTTTTRDSCVCYTLPIHPSLNLYLTQRAETQPDLNDFEICNRYRIDNTGLVCSWPSEDVLAFFCLSNPHMFRGKRVVELGSGYGLAGLVVATATEALEVVISDGNPQVVDYIQHNIEANSKLFGDTSVKSMMLHWNQAQISNVSNTFDIIIASDCTFFDDFHKDLARVTKVLLRNVGPSEAIFLSPRRGDSLEKFLKEVEKEGLHFSLVENYSEEVWKLHEKFMNGDELWRSYEKDHCYPLLVKITL